MEFFLASFAGFLWKMPVVVDNVEADRAFLHAREFLINIIFPQKDTVNNGVVSIMKLGL